MLTIRGRFNMSSPPCPRFGRIRGIPPSVYGGAPSRSFPHHCNDHCYVVRSAYAGYPADKLSLPCDNLALCRPTSRNAVTAADLPPGREVSQTKQVDQRDRPFADAQMFTSQPLIPWEGSSG